MQITSHYDKNIFLVSPEFSRLNEGNLMLVTRSVVVQQITISLLGPITSSLELLVTELRYSENSCTSTTPPIAR